MELTELTPDADLAKDGKWIDYGDEVALLIASSNTPAYRKALQKAMRKHPAHKVKKDLEIGLQAAIEAHADAVLLDFRGITDKGEPVENTRENRILLMRTQIGDFVADQAGDIATFQAEQEELDSTTLKKRSSGKRSGASTSDTSES